MNNFRVGVVGCGRISDIYLKTCKKFDILDIVSCASLDIEESRAKARLCLRPGCRVLKITDTPKEKLDDLKNI